MTDLNKLLADMHLAVTEELLRKVRSGEATAADLNVARALLKDNNISAKVVPGSPMGSLVDELPFTGDDPDDNLPFPRH